MKKFKIGDYVRVKKFETRPETWDIDGMMDHLMGKTIKIEKSCTEKSFFSTDEYGKRWAIGYDQVEPVNKCIVIYQRNDKVIALDKSTGKKEVAKCNPADTFDFNTGARLAFDRLLGNKTEKTPLNVKIVFTRGDEVFKTGHIYEVKDGKITAPDTGCKYPYSPQEDFTEFYSIAELKDYFSPTNERKLHKVGWTPNGLDFIVIEED